VELAFDEAFDCCPGVKGVKGNIKKPVARFCEQFVRESVAIGGRAVNCEVQYVD
jgi:hypothetical protein